MERERILNRIVGPLPFGSLALSWQFVSRRRTKHGLDSTQGRRFTITYNAETRTFRATCTRRVSKRLKREKVAVSKAMTDYLQSRLLPKHIAMCTAASLTRGRQQN